MIVNRPRYLDLLIAQKVVVLRDPIVTRYDENGVLFVGIEEFLTDESYLEACAGSA